MSADLPSLRALSPELRLKRILDERDFSEGFDERFLRTHPPLELADQWIENSIGYFSIPLGVIDHLVIDGRKVRVPVATEETSIIAAASSCAKWISAHGTLETETRGLESIGQIQFPEVRDVDGASRKIIARSKNILNSANRCVPGLVARGGGFTRIEVRPFPSMIVLHLYCDTRDAMGANLINQACEAVAIEIADWIGERVGLRILSNLVDTRRSAARIHLEGIDDGLAKGIASASRFAEVDPYRAATHNKGIMNAIDGILVATGNDWRAVEAGAHAFAARSGAYRPLSVWRSPAVGVLSGELDIPLALGTVGGVTRLHPTSAASLRMIGTDSAPGLARIIAAVGLLQNLAALRALASDGIVAGHMRLHLSNLILAADAKSDERTPLLALLQERLRTQRRISSADVQEVLTRLRNSDQTSKREINPRID
jgi:hydroxymethylglutaryl-CoA reductase